MSGVGDEDTVLGTERLLLRRWRDADIDVLTRWMADAEFMRHLTGRPATRDEAVAMFERTRAHWDEHGWGVFAAEERETGELVGRIGLAYHRAWPGDPECGWWVAPERQRRGYAREGGAAAVRWGFDVLGFDRLVSIATEANVASRRVQELLGFTLIEQVPFPEQGIELWVHALSRDAVETRGTRRPRLAPGGERRGPTCGDQPPP